jgi:hypothetical protein
VNCYASLGGGGGGGGGGGVSPSGFYLNSGSNYYIGPTFQPAILPLAGNFTWVNQGGASETATGNALVMSGPAGSSNWRMRVQSIATATVKSAFSCTIEPLQYRFCAVVFQESATGKIIAFGLSEQPPGYSLNISHYTNPSTFSNSVANLPAAYGNQALFWAELEVSGANLNFYLSNDGVNFVQVWSEAKTSFFTTAPDQWGYGVNCEIATAGQSSACINTLLSWNPV